MSKKKETPPSKEFEEPKSEPIQKKQDLVSLAVFLFTLSVVLITLVSVIFPALVASNNSILQELHSLGIIIGEAEPFEAGGWAVPLIVTNLIVFGLAILFFKKIITFFKFT